MKKYHKVLHLRNQVMCTKDKNTVSKRLTFKLCERKGDEVSSRVLDMCEKR